MRTYLYAILISLLTFVFSGPCRAGQPIDGNKWNSMDARAREACISGFAAGFDSLKLNSVDFTNIKAKKISNTAPKSATYLEQVIGYIGFCTKAFRNKDITESKLISDINRFYQNSSNLNIKLPGAILIANARYANISEDKINEVITMMREKLSAYPELAAPLIISDMIKSKK